MTTALVGNRRKESPRPRLRTTADGRLAVVIDSVLVPVRLRQCFPWSEPGLHLSLRDDENREVAVEEVEIRQWTVETRHRASSPLRTDEAAEGGVGRESGEVRVGVQVLPLSA